MRSERRKEIIEQMEADKKIKRRRKVNAICRTLSIIYTLLAISFVGLLAWMDVLPGKYFWPAVIGLAAASLFIVPVMFSKNGKSGRKTGATVAAIVLIGIFGVGTWYIVDTIDFLGEITVPKEVTEDYYVLVKGDALYEGVSELYGQPVGTHMTSDIKYSEAKALLQHESGVTYTYEETIGGVLAKLQMGEYPAAFISAASYEVFKAEDEAFETTFKILHTIKMKVETEDLTTAVDVTNESFNVYISGIDVEGDISTISRTDVNMLATVNPATHEVLLTSIPRDYYVNLPTKQASDKLTHSALYGIQETIGAVEDIMGIDINYYVRVNYTTMVKLVDALGGIEVNSPFDFTTSGMQHLNGHHFVKGINELDGNAALAFCRERKSFTYGDMQRNENQQLVMEAIIKKAIGSPAILTKYTSILEAVQSNMETNMTQEEMSSLIKMQLDGMPSWDISKQAIKGANGWGHCYALGFSAATVVQDPVENARAVDHIIGIMTDGNKGLGTSEPAGNDAKEE